MVQKTAERVLVTGGTGYIGAILTDYLTRGVGLEGVRSVGSADLDIRDRAAVRKAIASHKPSLILHLAAKADTDACEECFEEARQVNVDGALNVVEEGLETGAFVVHFSSACLYPDNRRAYGEEGPLKALCRYTETKLEAEQALEPYHNRIMFVRMRQPFSNHRHRRNLLEKLRRYTDFIDEPNAMSHLEECIPVIWALAGRRVTGPINITNPGWSTPLLIAERIRRHVIPTKPIREISYDTLLARVPAVRVNALVDCSRLESLGFELRPVESAIVDCLLHPVNLGEFTWPNGD